MPKTELLVNGAVLVVMIEAALFPYICRKDN